jgi:hypothetical protein
MSLSAGHTKGWTTTNREVDGSATGPECPLRLDDATTVACTDRRRAVRQIAAGSVYASNQWEQDAI